MDEEDVVIEVMRQVALQGCATIASLAAVNKQMCHLARLDTIWRTLCQRRWGPYAQASSWLADAARAEADAADTAGVWKAAYIRRERELISEWPVFIMGGSLCIGQLVGLHLFEPRYRLLIAHAMRTDQRFVFSSGCPQQGTIAFLCECHNVQMYEVL